MKRTRDVIAIDESRCDGCGLCAKACVEGAIEIVGGKARLVSESYCDGLGECPRGAITIERRRAGEFDGAAAKKRLAGSAAGGRAAPLPCGCPGTAVREIGRENAREQVGPRAGAARAAQPEPERSELSNWPVQLSLVPPDAPYLAGAELVLSADCVPFAFAAFHSRFLRGGRPVIIGCPKLDDADGYAEKLSAMIGASSPAGITVVRMEVPCCAGLLRIAEAACAASGARFRPREVVVGIDGGILSDSGTAVAL